MYGGNGQNQGEAGRRDVWGAMAKGGKGRREGTGRAGTCAGTDRLLDFFFFFNDAATTEVYTLSLHDALPISPTHLQTTNPKHAKKRNIAAHTAPRTMPTLSSPAPAASPPPSALDTDMSRPSSSLRQWCSGR